MVGAKGFEPSTSWSRTRRASQAALRPDGEAERGQETARRDLKNSTGNGASPAIVFCPLHGVSRPETRQSTVPSQKNRRRDVPLRRQIGPKNRLQRLKLVSQCELHHARVC